MCSSEDVGWFRLLMLLLLLPGGSHLPGGKAGSPNCKVMVCLFLLSLFFFFFLPNLSLFLPSLPLYPLKMIIWGKFRKFQRGLEGCRGIAGSL